MATSSPMPGVWVRQQSQWGIWIASAIDSHLSPNQNAGRRSITLNYFHWLVHLLPIVHRHIPQ